jgi:ATP-dependent Zn protease
MLVVPYRAFRRTAPVSKGAAELARARMCARQRMATGSAYPLGPIDDPLLKVAVHEAGHCEIAEQERSQIESVKINGAEIGGGRMRLRNADDLTCRLLMGGMAAEVVVFGYYEREGARTDLYEARRIAPYSDYVDVDAFLDRELRSAIALLESRRDALLELAGEITDKRQLSGFDVNKILSRPLIAGNRGGVQ